MIADGEVRLSQARLSNRLQNCEGQFVDGVFLVDRLPADCDILIHRRTGGAKRMRLRTNFLHGEALNPKASQKFNRLVASNFAGFNVLLVKRVHVLIHSAVAQRMPVTFDLQDNMNEPDGLNCFAEGVGGIVRNFFADTGNFFEFSLALRVGFFSGKFSGKFRVAERVLVNGVNYNQNCLVENIFVD